MMNKLLPALLAAALAASAVFAFPAGVSASEKIVGYTLKSNVVAKIGGLAIPSYNIDGYTWVAADDLRNYGFDVEWDGTAKTLTVYNGNFYTGTAPSGIPAYKPVKYGQKQLGQKNLPVLSTGIKCFLARYWTLDTQVKAYNIGDKTIISMDDLAAVYADSYLWDAGTDTLTLNPVIGWYADLANPHVDYTVTAIPEGFAFTFANRTTDNTAPDFEMTDCSGDYAAIDGFTVTQDWFGLSFYMRIETFGPFLDDLYNCVDILYGERVAADTPERRAALAKVYRVYVNGAQVSGELARSQGNGHVDFYFVFDRSVSLGNIQTIRVEIGYSS